MAHLHKNQVTDRCLSLVQQTGSAATRLVLISTQLSAVLQLLYLPHQTGAALYKLSEVLKLLYLPHQTGAALYITLCSTYGEEHITECVVSPYQALKYMLETLLPYWAIYCHIRHSLTILGTLLSYQTLCHHIKQATTILGNLLQYQAINRIRQSVTILGTPPSYQALSNHISTRLHSLLGT